MGGGGSKDRSAEVMAEMQAKMAQQQAQMYQRQSEMQSQHSKEMMEQQMAHTQMLLEQMKQNQAYEREQAAKFENYQAENLKLVKELEAARKTMEEELEKAEEKLINGMTDPDAYDNIQNDIFQKFCQKVEEVKDVTKTQKPSVAVLGQNGVGKSSLINALAETLVTPEGVVDTTTVVSKVFESPTTEYWDVPGCSEERSYTNLKQIMAIKEMHLIIIMYVDRVEHIVKLEKFIRACKVPYVCVRSKVDQIVDAGDKEAALEHEAKKLSAPLIFVSAKTREGIDSLKAVAKKEGVSL